MAEVEMLPGRVCFVDDEPVILRSVERLLNHHGIQANTFTSPKAALQFLAREPPDVVIADLRIAEMPGSEFLRLVQQRHPDCVRVVLTAAIRDRVQVFREVPYAHQFIAKPFDPASLVTMLEQALRHRIALERREVRALVASSNALPAAPATYAELIEVLRNPRCSMIRVAEVIERDVAMSARLVQLLSSAYFGIPPHMASIGGATAYLGTNAIRSLVLSAEITQMFPFKIPGFSSEQVQARCLATAKLAQKICSGDKQLKDQAFLAGLFHAVGQLILASRAPQQFAEALRLSELRAISLCDAERETCGASDAEAGAYLLGLWGMPLEVTQAIAKQETPLAIDHDCPGLTTLLYVCKRLSRDPEAPLSEAPACGEDALYAYYLQRVGALDALPDWREAARCIAA